MPDLEAKAPEAEPIGIIITRGPTVLHAPRFSAYLWAMADEPDRPPEETKAA